jgi:hypothetical protein
VIERSIVYALANLVATNQVITGDCIEISLKPDGTLAFNKIAAVAAVAAAG